MTRLILFGSYAVLAFLAIYIFVYIPNKKKQRARQALHKSLAPGDEIITIGGVVGTVVERDGDYVTLMIDKKAGITLQVVLYAVSQIKQKGNGSLNRPVFKKPACFR